MLVSQLTKLTLDIQGFRVGRVQGDTSGITVDIAPDRRHLLFCSRRGSAAKYRDTLTSRYFRHVPLWGIPVWLRYSPRRVRCGHCGVKVEYFPWSTGKHRFTTAFAHFLASWARLLPWKHVAQLFGCSWGTVAAAVDQMVEYGLAHQDLSNLTHIGIDEISREKGQVYLTNVYDLNTSKLVWSGEKRTKATITNFFTSLGPNKTDKLKGVCCDMWEPYIKVIQAKAPKATMVFDKFHIVRHLNEAVDQVRRDEIREKGQKHKDLVKDTRYIWLKNPWNLTDKQASRLSALEKLNLKINRAYLLKESFRQFWSYECRASAKEFLDKWFWWATHSRLKPMRNFAWMLRRKEENILSYFDMPISNGSVEGLNNKAKVISHRAYGFRSAKNYIRNLYHCMGGLPEPQIMHRFV